MVPVLRGLKHGRTCSKTVDKGHTSAVALGEATMLSERLIRKRRSSYLPQPFFDFGELQKLPPPASSISALLLLRLPRYASLLQPACASAEPRAKQFRELIFKDVVEGGVIGRRLKRSHPRSRWRVRQEV